MKDSFLAIHIPCGKQSWKTARIAARALSLHWRLVTKSFVSSPEMVVQTAGHVVALLVKNDGYKLPWTEVSKANIAMELVRSMIAD